MFFYADERIGLFIDGANNHSALKGLQFDIDFKRLLDVFRKRGHLITARYYTALLVADDGHSIMQPLVDWLSYNGYRVVTKPAKEFTDVRGDRRIKGNMDCELIVDALRLAPSLDHVVLFSGDGDFSYMVEALKEMGKRVTVVSSLVTKPPMVADSLRRAADQFVDLDDLEPLIGRERVSEKA